MEENRKYELVEDDFILHEGKKLYRIKALKRFITFLGTIRRGDIGGYVEGYHNLSQEDYCWIFNDAKVYGNARIEDYATVAGGAEVFGNAVLKEDANVHENSQVYGNAIIEKNTNVTNSKVYGNAVLKSYSFGKVDNVDVCNNTIIFK